jgi:ABC-2 type transport system permease protein
VTDLDQSIASAAFVQRMDDVDELRVTRMPETEAREATRKGNKVAYIILPEGFGSAYSSLFSGGTPEVILGVDPSRKAEAGMLEGVMMKLGVERFENALSGAGGLANTLDESIKSISEDESMPADWKSLLGQFLPQIKQLNEQDAQNPGDQPGSSNKAMASALTPLILNFEEVAIQKEGPKNGYAVTIPQAMYWAIMGVIMGFGVALVQEKTLGTMTRLVSAPVSRFQILAGKALGCFSALFVVITALFIFARFVFDVPIDDPIKALFAVLCVSIGFVGFMMFLAAIGKTERGVSSLGWGVMMVFAMFGGAMIPLFAMPDWMKSVSSLSPVKWAILSLEGATWRNFSYTELMVPCGIMLILGVVFFALGNRLLKLED